MKSFAILGRTDSSLQTEQDFRETCALFENQKIDHNSQISQAYEKYVSSHHKITSLSLLYRDGAKMFLHAFDTEKETAKMYKVKVPEQFGYGVCIAALPNGELFCFGDLKNPGILLYLIEIMKFDCCQKESLATNLQQFISIEMFIALEEW